MTQTIDFIEGVKKLSKTPPPTDEVQQRGIIVSLLAEIDAAQQAEKARQMVAQGYVGSGLKAVVAQAHTLEGHLVNAGRIAQSLACKIIQD